ncbi:P-loop containing nucleoside triphosphate hydrolase protein [Fimicolochytrium jonesii]|uniref:P-loop containing nucleoside triphosphate hydrolase protein n=1 Tax=Fimicolochytrium jonesii TaxID=1396493 RepID=UPI0022FDBD43|nr:P-loop containing nucleoside triphosphate hydrolase protein [Fimicolochytrium jonesii]KAI8822188.1 P-loop containing nucleoside triphosphate hydrolase protein [Fimicolochytrium jonesii]
MLPDDAVVGEGAPATLNKAAIAQCLTHDSTRPESLDISIHLRVRPLLAHETSASHFAALSTTTPTTLRIFAPKTRFDGAMTVNESSVKVDRVFGMEEDSDRVYEAVGVPLVCNALGGGVSTVMAYGQTGSGKTTTLTALQQRLATEIFDICKEYRRLLDGATGEQEQVERDDKDATATSDFQIRVSFFEIFGSEAFDLLNDRLAVKILEDGFGSIQVHNIREETITTPTQFHTYITRAAGLRRTASTAKNTQSSRSHAICRVRVTNTRIPQSEDGILYLVDLAGSEGSKDTKHHDKDRIAESKEINKSLSALKESVRARAMAFATDKFVHVPYRTSKLTMLLKDAFEISSAKQSRTVIIGTLAPSVLDVPETINTTRFIASLKDVPATLTKRNPTRPNTPTDPATWDNAYLCQWVTSNSRKISPSVLCPFESGKQLCRLPEGQFLERCLRCEGVTEKGAKVFYLKLWKLVVDAKTRKRKEVLGHRPGLEERERRAEEMDREMAAL